MQQMWPVTVVSLQIARWFLLLRMVREDVGSLQISARDLLRLAFLSVGEGILRGQAGIADPAALLPGIGLLLFSRITGEEIGAGDGWLFLGLGFSLDGAALWQAVRVTLGIAGGWSLMRVASGADRKEELPLVPFAAIAVGMQLPIAVFQAAGIGGVR